MKLCDGAKMAIFLRPVFPASRVQHISDPHSKFALGPHHVWKYGRHPIGFFYVTSFPHYMHGDHLSGKRKNLGNVRKFNSFLSGKFTKLREMEF